MWQNRGRVDAHAAPNRSRRGACADPAAARRPNRRRGPRRGRRGDDRAYEAGDRQTAARTYGQSSERGRKVLDQLELQLEELEAETSENAVTAQEKAAGAAVASSTRRRPARAPLPAHLPRERVVVAAPCTCPVCGGRLAKLGEDITETLEVVPRQWKVIQTVREKFTCRSCEKITQPPAPFHAIARARAGASLLAMILYAK